MHNNKEECTRCSSPEFACVGRIARQPNFTIYLTILWASETPNPISDRLFGIPDRFRKSHDFRRLPKPSKITKNGPKGSPRVDFQCFWEPFRHHFSVQISFFRKYVKNTEMPLNKASGRVQPLQNLSLFGQDALDFPCFFHACYQTYFFSRKIDF